MWRPCPFTCSTFRTRCPTLCNPRLKRLRKRVYGVEDWGRLNSSACSCPPDWALNLTTSRWCSSGISEPKYSSFVWGLQRHLQIFSFSTDTKEMLIELDLRRSHELLTSCLLLTKPIKALQNDTHALRSLSGYSMKKALSLKGIESWSYRQVFEDGCDISCCVLVFAHFHNSSFWILDEAAIAFGFRLQPPQELGNEMRQAEALHYLELFT